MVVPDRDRPISPPIFLLGVFHFFVLNQSHKIGVHVGPIFFILIQSSWYGRPNETDSSSQVKSKLQRTSCCSRECWAKSYISKMTYLLLLSSLQRSCVPALSWRQFAVLVETVQNSFSRKSLKQANSLDAVFSERGNGPFLIHRKVYSHLINYKLGSQVNVKIAFQFTFGPLEAIEKFLTILALETDGVIYLKEELGRKIVLCSHSPTRSLHCPLYQ